LQRWDGTFSPCAHFHPVEIAKAHSMKALCWHGTNDIRCDNVPDPKIEDGRDVIIKVTSCAICGSDLHLMDGLMPTMKSGDILGHEFMETVKLAGVQAGC
jgi:threonine dehydrogenase-like Zn-dependent dehydrogenase